MIDSLLKVANVISVPKLIQYYPELVQNNENEYILNSLFYGLVNKLSESKNISKIFYLLKSKHEESRKIIAYWQENEDVPHPLNTTFHGIISYSHYNSINSISSYNLPTEISQKRYASLLEEIAPLWFSLLAIKIENDNLSLSQFRELLNSSHRIPTPQSTTQPSKEDTETTTNVDNHNALDTSSKSIDEDDEDYQRLFGKKKNQSWKTLVIILLTLFVLGMIFFSTGHYEKWFKNHHIAKSQKNEQVVFTDTPSNEKLVSPFDSVSIDTTVRSFMIISHNGQSVRFYNDEPDYMVLKGLMDSNRYYISDIHQLHKLDKILNLYLIDTLLRVGIQLDSFDYMQNSLSKDTLIRNITVVNNNSEPFLYLIHQK